MARLAWIASELGSATGFPKETSYRRSLNPTRVGIQRWVHDDAVVPVVRLAGPICSFSPSTFAHDAWFRAVLGEWSYP